MHTLEQRYVHHAAAERIHRKACKCGTHLERAAPRSADEYLHPAGTHGYQAGCAFAEGNFQAAVAASESRDLLCAPELLDLCNVDDCVTDILDTAFEVQAQGANADELFAALQVVWAECLAERPPDCFVCLNDFSAGGICRREIEGPALSELTFDGDFDFPSPV